MNGLRRLLPCLLALPGLLMSAGPVLACAVCFGSPDSSMTQGARAGILLLLGVIGSVLAGIVAVTLFWVRRARMLDAQAAFNPADGRRAHA